MTSHTIGQTIVRTEVEVVSGVNNQLITLPPHIAAGTYLIRVVDPQSNVTIDRIVIQ